MERRKVDLPHPDGPISAVMDRGGISTEISKSACFSPYQNENPPGRERPRRWPLTPADVVAGLEG